MLNPNELTVVLPVFAGQGTTRASLKHAADQAIRDAESPIGSLILSSCLDAFLAELAALSPEDIDQSGICPSDFDDPRLLLTPDPKYAQNHIISGTFLFLAQVLRYQSYAQSTSRSLLGLLKLNIDYAAGVLGLSSGIFPACVVATSHNPISYITTAVEVFRSVFWIALRVLQFTRQLSKEKPMAPTLPWSIACLGLTKAGIEEQIVRFEQKYCRIPSLHVTAILDEKNITVSGRPDLLVKFSTFVSRHCTVHPTTVDGFYHSERHLSETRGRILADICRRNIRFPDYDKLRCPLRSTISGEIVHSSADYPSLVESVIDMVLVYPVNWDLVARKVASAVPAGVSLWAVNMGPGSSALRALESVVPKDLLVCIDATSDLRTETAFIPPRQEPIAIIGMAAHTPGAANTDQLWEILKRGTSTVSKIPDDRFQLPLCGDGLSPCKTRVETGNFMDDFADFDHKFFKISPREARSMDPQQRVLLHTAYEALENAGFVPDATPCFRRAHFGCYIGAATQDYAENLAENIDLHYATGTLRAFLSGRISYVMQWGGPSVVVDTACSSSIVAIHQACRALMVKDCNAALAGGVNVMTSPNTFVGLERGHFLSPSGQCKPFDALADGYSRAEGCCLFVLKRLSDAIAENDHIIGIIRGIEVNQSGLAPSVTHPHTPTQTDLLKTLLEHSGIGLSRISVVEAHGTGTEAGDSCELASIRAVFSQGRTRDNPLHVTSIKANVGHLEAASGAIGLCKLLLMLRYGVIPAQISLKTLHPLIAPLDADNTMIDTIPTPWIAESTPRVAVLNNFGAAGSNGALVLEEYIQPEHPPMTSSSSFVFGISAKSVGALEHLRSRYVAWLGDPRNYDVPLCDIAYTSTARRQLYPFRLAVAAWDRDQLVRSLETTPVTHVKRHGGKVIFVFSGQGSQYPNMGASLYTTSTIFRSCIDRCHRFLLSLGYPGILPIISPEACDHVLGANEEFEAYQCAVLAVEHGLATLWKHFGVTPAAVIGQSLGEYAAMVTAGVLSIDTALSIVAKRARLMSQRCAIGKTGMASITHPSAQVKDVLTTHGSFSNVTIACVNTETSCVVAGPVQELRGFAAYMMSAFGCKTVVLDVQLGFHSSAMDPILDELKDHVATLPVHAPSIPIASNVWGTVIPVGDSLAFQGDYLVKHCRQTVLFARGLRELEQYMDPTQVEAWIDVGPHAICLPMVKMTLAPSLCLPTMLKEKSVWDTLMSSLAQLYQTAVPVDWRHVFDECGTCSCVDLPTYPFYVQKFWVPYSDRSIDATLDSTLQHPPPGHPMLSTWSQYPSRQNGNAAIFETPIGCLATYIEGHKVGGYALCPASVYLEQALSGAVIAQCHMELDFGRSMPVLRTVEFSRPLVLHQDVHLIVRTHVTVHEDGTGSFQIMSRLDSSHKEHMHVHGELRFSSVRETMSNLALELSGNVGHVDGLIQQDTAPEVFSTHTAYEVVFPRVVEYAKEYHTIQSLMVRSDGAASVAQVALSSLLGVQPIFLDTLLHVAGFMVNMRGNVSDVYICSSVGLVKVLRDLVDDKQLYTMYCTNNRISSHDIVSTDILAIQGCDPHVVVAYVRGAQFRRVRLTSLHRGLAMAADPRGSRNRARTDSNAIMTPSSPRSVIFARSRSNTQSTALFYNPGFRLDKLDVQDTDTPYTGCSGPASPETLVSESGYIFEQRASGVDSERVRKVMADVLGIEDDEEMEDDTDLGALGLDSLGSIEAQQALRVALNRPIPHNIFAECPTVSALCDFLVDQLDEGEDVLDMKTTPYEGGLLNWKDQNHASSSDVILVPLQKCSSSLRAPLYLIHDGSGLVGHYERLLSLNRDVWGISNPRFFCGEVWESLEDMAEAYAQVIERHANGYGLILGGWSFGGVVAFEMTRVLASRGVKVKGVVLIDSPSPTAPPLLSDALIERLLREQGRAIDDTLTRALVSHQFRQNSALLAKYASTVRNAVPEIVPLAFLRCTAGFCPDNMEAGDKNMSIPEWFRERNDVDRDLVVGTWEALMGVGSIPVWDVPGHHFESFSPVHAKATSAQLDRACQHLDAH